MYQKLLKEFQTCKVLVLSSFLLTLYKLLEEYIENAMELHLLDDPPNNQTPWVPDFLTKMLPSLQNLNSIITRVDTVRSSTSRTQTQPNDSSARNSLGLTTPNFLLTFIENLKESLESIQPTGTTTNQCEGNSNERNRPESRLSPILVPPPPPTFHDSPEPPTYRPIPTPPTYRSIPTPPIYHQSPAPPVRPRHFSPLLAPSMGGGISRPSRPPRPAQGTPSRPYRNSRWHRPPHRHRSPKYEPYYPRHHN
ncbi:uncharacterized protein LOC126780342 [Nymphalis io]|uniref:uncharacterized protein LOC126780342 n=1 Tax=Inachis io TaxID=171585 RepID=UPI002169507D|nr:uncharacterized protein LOC126780342 [Nymphalis io]